MKEYNIGIIPGDGTGPEVVAEAVKSMKAISDIGGPKFNLTYYDIGGERYLKKGELLPESVAKELSEMDSSLLGAIGHPDVKPGILEKNILLKLRFDLDLYINLRPVVLLPGVYTPLKDKGPEEINFVIVRENTEGLYAGAGGILKKGTADEVAVQESINTRKGVERCIRYAFEYCKKRNKERKLTLCGKTNVLTYAFDLWDRAFHEVGTEYPDIVKDYAHVDAICMWMVKNPEFFDVIVTDNLFGDIITDLGAMIQGGMGIAAGGNIKPEGTGVFEPIGGSAPKYTGLNKINPMAAICAVQMMLDHLDEGDAAEKLQTAIKKVAKNDLKSMGAGRMGYGTKEVGDLVVNYIVKG